MTKSCRWMFVVTIGIGVLGLIGPVAVRRRPPALRDATEAGDLTGTVKDKTGGALVGAQVIVLTPQRAVVATTTTDKSGKFKVTGLADGQYLVIVKYTRAGRASGGRDHRRRQPPPLDIVLEVVKLGEDVTVTANPGGVGDIDRIEPAGQRHLRRRHPRRGPRPWSRRPSTARPASICSARARAWPASSCAA